MSYPRNAASPPTIAIGAVVQISDGAVQTSGVSVVIRPEGEAESPGSGTIAYSASSGVVYYTPTQAETNYTAFCVIAYKTACIPAQVTVVPSASDTPGVVELDSATVQEIADAVGTTGGGDWSDTEKAQIRYRLGLDGTATAPEDPDEEPIVITPGSGSFTTGYLTCLDERGEVLPDCPVYWHMIEAPPANTGFAYDSSRATTQSASNGVAQMLKLVKGATYLFFRGKEVDGVVVTIPSSAGATYELPSLRGY